MSLYRRLRFAVPLVFFELEGLFFAAAEGGAFFFFAFACAFSFLPAAATLLLPSCFALDASNARNCAVAVPSSPTKHSFLSHVGLKFSPLHGTHDTCHCRTRFTTRVSRISLTCQPSSPSLPSSPSSSSSSPAFAAIFFLDAGGFSWLISGLPQLLLSF